MHDTTAALLLLPLSPLCCPGLMLWYYIGCGPGELLYIAYRNTRLLSGVNRSIPTPIILPPVKCVCCRSSTSVAIACVSWRRLLCWRPHVVPCPRDSSIVARSPCAIVSGADLQSALQLPIPCCLSTSHITDNYYLSQPLSLTFFLTMTGTSRDEVENNVLRFATPSARIQPNSKARHYGRPL